VAGDRQGGQRKKQLHGVIVVGIADVQRSRRAIRILEQDDFGTRPSSPLMCLCSFSPAHPGDDIPGMRACRLKLYVLELTSSMRTQPRTGLTLQQPNFELVILIGPSLAITHGNAKTETTAWSD
jgi:hypothetical protein